MTQASEAQVNLINDLSVQFGNGNGYTTEKLSKLEAMV
jgi:hypothetical protein